MKRLLTATALSTMALTAPLMAANTATIAETETIQRYAPDANVEALSEAKLRSVLNAINSAESNSDLYQTVPAMLSADAGTEMNTATPEQLSAIEQYAPGVDTTTLTQDQVLASIGIINSTSSENDKTEQVQAIVMGDDMASPAMPTAGERAAIERYVPNVNYDALTTGELRQAMNVINGGDSESQKRTAVEAIIR